MYKLKRPLIIFTGPSGAGKDSIRLPLQKEGLPMEKVVTYTTRKPREGEKEGVDYHFIDENVFLELIEKEEFLEHFVI